MGTENKGIPLELLGVSKRFGKTVAVDGVDLRIPAGAFVGVVGSSGAGKSTLLRLVNRMIDPSEGSIVAGDRRIEGLRGGELRRWRAQCAMIFQHFNLVPRLDALTNVLTGALARKSAAASLVGWFVREEREEAFHALEQVGMSEYALRRVETLSGGQQQRVAIARAMMQRPAVLLADEPIAALDPNSAEVVLEMLARLNGEGLTVIVNLHHVDAAQKWCKRLVGMKAGRVFFDRPSSEVSADDFQALYGMATLPTLAQPAKPVPALAINQQELCL